MQGRSGTGAAISALRDAAGISRKDLAAKAGIGYRYLVEVENGTRTPAPKWVAHVTEWLGDYISGQAA